MSSTSSPLLRTTNIVKNFGGLRAIHDLSFEVKSGQIKGIIGPNGAGKTTLFNLLTGVFPVTEGEIKFRDHVINDLKPYEIAILGISRTFQNVRLFHEMTVLENIMVGQHCRTRSSIMSAGFRLPKMKKEEERILSISHDLLSFVGLSEKASWTSSKLPIGQQKALEIARALATEPSLLMLDEPAAGLSEFEIDDLKKLIQKIQDNQITVLLVEHDMDLVMKICEEILVLDFGKKIAEGLPEDIKRSKEVINAYLGEEEYA
jgi:branched-chain amino acid transport system ATP-binding protein